MKISARNLHKKIGIKTEFATWIKNEIKRYGLVEGADYMSMREPVLGKVGGRPRVEYYITRKAYNKIKNNYTCDNLTVKIYFMREVGEQEFFERLKEKRPDIELLSEYKGLQEKIMFRCGICGSTSNVLAISLITRTKCVFCRACKEIVVILNKKKLKFDSLKDFYFYMENRELINRRTLEYWIKFKKKDKLYEEGITICSIGNQKWEK